MSSPFSLLNLAAVILAAICTVFVTYWLPREAMPVSTFGSQAKLWHFIGNIVLGLSCIVVANAYLGLDSCLASIGSAVASMVIQLISPQASTVLRVRRRRRLLFRGMRERVLVRRSSLHEPDEALYDFIPRYNLITKN